MVGLLKKLFGFGGEVTADAILIKGIPAIWNALKGAHDALPESVKQKLPGFLSLSLADEQIFNGVLGQLEPKKQVVIMDFLSQCKDYERNRFINIVAGMEVIEEGKLDETKESFDDNGKKVIEKKSSSKGKKDKRKEFLESFANVISEEFDNDFDRAYKFCIAGRIIIQDPVHQKIIRNFSESVKWFHNLILDPTKTSSLKELGEKIGKGFSGNLDDWTKKSSDFAAKQKAAYESAKANKKGRRS
jgi:hypothetical protein